MGYKDFMMKYANKRLYRKEDTLDVVHDTFVKAQEYENKTDGAKISSFILLRELDRAIRRANRTSAEMPAGDMSEDTRDIDEVY